VGEGEGKRGGGGERMEEGEGRVKGGRVTRGGVRGGK